MTIVELEKGRRSNCDRTRYLEEAAAAYSDDLELRLSPMSGLVSVGTDSRTTNSMPGLDSSHPADSRFRFYFWDGSGWMDFTPYSNALLQDALARRPLEKVIVPGGIDGLYQVDIKNKIQKNVKTGYIRSIAWECHATGSRVGFDTPSERLELLQGGSEDTEMCVEIGDNRSSRLAALTIDKAAGFSSKLGQNVRSLETGSAEFCAVKLLFEKGHQRTHGNSNFRPRLTAIQKVVNSVAKSSHFGEQVLEMERSRGDANLRYAWYGASVDEIAYIVMYGFGEKSIGVGNGNLGHYGYGTYLASDCKVEVAMRSAEEDGNKERHILLCEVILGESEVILPGSSHRFLPDSESYDSGIDDLENPTLYVMWAPFINSHIIPWYIVSFVASADECVSQQSTCRPPKVFSRRLNSTRTSPYPPLKVPARDPNAVRKLFQPSSISPSLSPASQATWLSILASPTRNSPTTTTALQGGINSLSLASPISIPSIPAQNVQKATNSLTVLASPTSVLHESPQRRDYSTALAPAFQLSLVADTISYLPPIVERGHRDSPTQPAVESAPLHHALGPSRLLELPLLCQQRKDTPTDAAAIRSTEELQLIFTRSSNINMTTTKFRSTKECQSTTSTPRRSTTFCRPEDTSQLGGGVPKESPLGPRKGCNSNNSNDSGQSAISGRGLDLNVRPI